MLRVDIQEFKSFIQPIISDAINEALQKFSPKEQPKKDRYISKKEAAKLAGVSVSTIDNWRRAKEIKSYHFGSSVRFNLKELQEYLSNK